MEPELGLGIILDTGNRRVRVFFPAAEVVREYSQAAAPLRRVRIQVGDTVSARDGRSLSVAEIEEVDGLLAYRAEDGATILETELPDTLSFTSPDKRLLNGSNDGHALFELRKQALNAACRWRASDLRGLTGARIGLIGHQLYIAKALSSRVNPRVLLADEVGLGKTIEAGLILSRLISSGQVGRVLILTPESLQHQWFVELLRKFNLSFKVAGAEYLSQYEDVNAFEQDQLYIAGLGFLSTDRNAMQQAYQAGWDLLIVDEAHHLKDDAYEFVAALSEIIPSVLLLSATPEQAGAREHFNRLRLLDADRFGDYDQFKADEKHFAKVAQLAERLLDGKKPRKTDSELLERLGLAADEPDLLAALIDRHGPGRVIFRNTRAAITGFPERRLLLQELPDGDLEALSQEFAADLKAKDKAYDFSDDARVKHLAQLLRASNDKVLLICRSAAKVKAIEEALMKHVMVKAAVFHEGLSLLQRDRNAAWFAEEDGARILLCSEIGSEGRNFQFSHRLFLFDLPLDPEVLEQRIGRLDRIGQRQPVEIHVPVTPASPQAALARWYHEGLNAFERNLACGAALCAKYGKKVLAAAKTGAAMNELIAQSAATCAELEKKLADGRDRLLEMSSCRKDVADDLVERIAAEDDSEELENFMWNVLEYFQVDFDEIAAQTYVVTPAESCALPGLKPEGLSLTFDRAQALKREDLTFLTWDHPLVTNALEVFLGGEKGNCCLALAPECAGNGLLLEANYVFEALAPQRLAIERFLAPSLFTVVIDHNGEAAELPETLVTADEAAMAKLAKPLMQMLPRLKRKAKQQARGLAAATAEEAMTRMQTEVGAEIERLEALRLVNPAVRQDEIDALKEQYAELEKHLSDTRLRLDSLRVIFKGALA